MLCYVPLKSKIFVLYVDHSHYYYYYSLVIIIPVNSFNLGYCVIQTSYVIERIYNK